MLSENVGITQDRTMSSCSRLRDTELVHVGDGQKQRGQAHLRNPCDMSLRRQTTSLWRAETTCQPESAALQHSDLGTLAAASAGLCGGGERVSQQQGRGEPGNVLTQRASDSLTGLIAEDNNRRQQRA